MIDRTNVSSIQVVQISTKHNNIPTSFTYTVIRIMQEISPTGATSPQNLTSTMAPPHTGLPRNNPRYPITVPMRKQEQCI